MCGQHADLISTVQQGTAWLEQSCCTATATAKTTAERETTRPTAVCRHLCTSSFTPLMHALIKRRNKNTFYFQPHLCCLFSSPVLFPSPNLVLSFQTHLPLFSLTSFPSLYCFCCFFPLFLLSLSLRTFNSTPHFLLQPLCRGPVSTKGVGMRRAGGVFVCDCVPVFGYHIESVFVHVRVCVKQGRNQKERGRKRG